MSRRHVAAAISGPFLFAASAVSAQSSVASAAVGPGALPPSVSAATERSCDSVGLIGNDTTDETAALNAAIANAAAGHYKLVCNRNMIFKVTSEIVDSMEANIDWNGATIDGSSQTTGAVPIVLVTPTYLESGDFTPSLQSNLTIKGPPSGSSSTAMVLCLQGNSNIPGSAANRWEADNFNIRYGYTGLGFGANSFLLTFKRFNVSDQYHIGVDLTPYGNGNSGENIRFENATIYGVRSSPAPTLGTGVGIYADSSGANSADANFVDTSVDYSDSAVQVKSGHVNFLGGHIETDGTNPFVALQFSKNSSAPDPTVSLVGTQLDQPGHSDPISQWPEPPGGRTALLTESGGSWEELNLIGVQWEGSSGEYNTKLITTQYNEHFNISGLSIGYGGGGNSGSMPSMGALSPLALAGTFPGAGISGLNGWADKSPSGGEYNYFRNSTFSGSSPAQTVPITSLVASGGTVTATTSITNGLNNGDWIPIVGATAGWSGPNGFVQIANLVTNKSFTYSCSSCSGSAPTPGSYTNHGVLPTNWSLSGGSNTIAGLSYQVLSPATGPLGEPVLRIRLYGTTNTNAAAVFYVDDGSNSIPTVKYDAWKWDVKARAENPVGAGTLRSIFVQTCERLLNGDGNGCTSISQPLTYYYNDYVNNNIVSNINGGTTSYVEPALGMYGWASGEVVDTTIDIDDPEFVTALSPVTHQLSTLTNNPNSVAPSGEYGVDTSGANGFNPTTGNALHLSGNGATAQNQLYFKLSATGGQWLSALGWIKAGTCKSGGFGLEYEEYDASGNLITSGNVDPKQPNYNSTCPSAYQQYSGIVQLNSNVSYVYVRPWLNNYSGDVYFDNVEATVF